MLKLSIIIVNYHSVDSLNELLASTKKMEFDIPIEWIIVNNSPQDDDLHSAIQVLPRISNLQFIESIENQGFAAACNAGVKYASGEIILFLNPDCKFCGGNFSTIIQRMEDDPQIGAIGPKLYDGSGIVEFSWSTFPGLFSEACMKTKKWLANKSILLRRIFLLNYNRAHRVDWVTGGALFIRRSIYQEIGGFDERFFLYFEDADLCKRLHRAGYSVWFDPSFSLIHERGGSQKTVRNKVKMHYRRSQIIYYSKHTNVISQLILRLFLRLQGKMPIEGQ